MKSDNLKINFKRRAVGGLLKVVTFKESEYHIAYIKSLNLSGYGNTEDEAVEMLMDAVVPEFFKEMFTVSDREAWHELEKLGWKKSKYFKSQFHSDSYVDKDGLLKEFNLPQDTQIKDQLIKV